LHIVKGCCGVHNKEVDSVKLLEPIKSYTDKELLSVVGTEQFLESNGLSTELTIKVFDLVFFHDLNALFVGVDFA